MSAGVFSSCGIRNDGAVICWNRTRFVPAPAEADGFVPVDWIVDWEMCRPQGTDHTTAGFPLPRWAVPAIGTIQVAVLFVDFPDAPATHSTRQEAGSNLSWMENYLQAASYGKLKVEFTPLYKWLRAEQNSDHYQWGLIRIDQEAVRLADSEFDFTGHHALMIVMPSNRFTGGNATRNRPHGRRQPFHLQDQHLWDWRVIRPTLGTRSDPRTGSQPGTLRPLPLQPGRTQSPKTTPGHEMGHRRHRTNETRNPLSNFPQ